MLTFESLRSANVERCETSYHPIGAWSLTDWACAMVGETGEACNVVKKLRRLDIGNGFARLDTETSSKLLHDLANELADVIIYTDLLAERAGIDLGTAIQSKFNHTSERIQSQIRL